MGRNKTYLKTFIALYVVGTTFGLLFTDAGDPWEIGAVLAIVGTLAFGAYLGGRDYLQGSSPGSTSAE